MPARLDEYDWGRPPDPPLWLQVLEGVIAAGVIWTFLELAIRLPA